MKVIDVYNIWLTNLLKDNNSKDISIINYLIKMNENTDFSENNLLKIQTDLENLFINFYEINVICQIIKSLKDSNLLMLFNKFENLIHQWIQQENLKHKFQKFETYFFVALFLIQLIEVIKSSNYSFDSLIYNWYLFFKDSIKKLSIDFFNSLTDDFWAKFFNFYSMIAVNLQIIIISFNEGHVVWNITNQNLINFLSVYLSNSIKLPRLIEFDNYSKLEIKKKKIFKSMLVNVEEKQLLSETYPEYDFSTIADSYLYCINSLKHVNFKINIDYLHFILELNLDEFHKKFKYLDNFNVEKQLDLIAYVNKKLDIIESSICFYFFFFLFSFLMFSKYVVYFEYFFDSNFKFYPYGYPIILCNLTFFKNCFLSCLSTDHSKPILNDNVINNLDGFMLDILKKQDISQFLFKIKIIYLNFQILGGLLKNIKLMKLTNIYNLGYIENGEIPDLFRYIRNKFTEMIILNNLINFEEYEFHKNLENLFLNLWLDLNFMMDFMTSYLYGNGSIIRNEKLVNYFLQFMQDKNHIDSVRKFCIKVEKLFSQLILKEFPQIYLVEKICNLIKKNYIIVDTNWFCDLKLSHKKSNNLAFFNLVYLINIIIRMNLIYSCFLHDIPLFVTGDYFYIPVGKLDKFVLLYNMAYIEEIIWNRIFEKFLKLNNIYLTNHVWLSISRLLWGFKHFLNIEDSKYSLNLHLIQ